MKSLSDDREYLGRQMAELHFILLTKRDNHGLLAPEREWFDSTEKYYGEFGATLDKEKILFELAKARVMDKIMASTVTGEDFDVRALQSVRNRLYLLDKKNEKNLASRLLDKVMGK